MQFTLAITVVNVSIVYKSVTKKNIKITLSRELLAMKLSGLSASTRKPAPDLRRDYHNIAVGRNTGGKSTCPYITLQK